MRRISLADGLDGMRKLAIFDVNYNGLSSLGGLFFEALDLLVETVENLEGADVWFADNGSTNGSLNASREVWR